MNRKDEIRQMASQRYGYEYTIARACFVDGAECADRSMVEKACDLYRRELAQCRNLLNRVKAGAGDIIDIEKSVLSFKQRLEQ